MPVSPLRLFLLLAALFFLVLIIQFGALSIAFEKLSLSSESAYLLLIVTLAGSLINLPLFRVETDEPPIDPVPSPLRKVLGVAPPPFTGTTIVAVNVGGCVTPVAFSAYLLSHSAIDASEVVLTIAIVAAIAYLTSATTPGIGITMPFLIAPVTAALVASALSPEHRAPLAYIGGTMGVLIGADVLRLKQIGRLRAPVAAIGGAGSFDGIFLSGLLAVLLA